MNHQDPQYIIFYLACAIIAITFHEAAHAWVAWKRGDNTAYMLGRVTCNPIPHIDPFGTILLPLMLSLSGAPMFGWAKPVPVREGRLKSPRWDGALVAVAGVTANILLAVFFSACVSLLLHLELEGGMATTLTNFLLMAVQLNLVFAVFNLLPIPPLDGYRFFSTFLPPRVSFKLARIEPYGIWVLLGLIFVAPLLGSQINLLGILIGQPVAFLMDVIFTAVGMPQ